jgi:cation:H+ antiporter
MIDVILLVAGFVLLIKGADLLVSGSQAIAVRLGVSSLVVGMTIVAFGTSLPEMVVTFASTYRGSADLAIGNILGSNIANVLLVLGVAAIIRPLPVHEQTVVSEVPFSLAAALLVGFLANAALFTAASELTISRLDGGILLFFFMLFMVYVYKVSRGDWPQQAEAGSGNTMRSIIYIVAGIAGLYVGGTWVVAGAVGIATMLGISEALIGLTVVAIGTSTPELIASAVAAYRRQPDIAVGNVVGSNIFNLLWVLGLTASFKEMPFATVSNVDVTVVIGSSALILLALIAGRSNTIMRSHGVLFVVLYALYLAYAVLR